MTENKSELRALLDFLEDAGFTVTYYREKDFFDTNTGIIIKSGDNKQRKTSEIAALFENSAYRVLEIREESEGKKSVKIEAINN